MTKKGTNPCYGTTAKWIDLRHYIMYSSNLGLQTRAKKIGVSYEVDSETLYRIALKNPNINKIWENFKYTRKINDSISFDRINPALGYTEDNMQCMTFADNQHKRAFDNITKKTWKFGPDGYGISTAYNAKGEFYRYVVNETMTGRSLTFADYEEAKGIRNKNYAERFVQLVNHGVILDYIKLPLYLNAYLV